MEANQESAQDAAIKKMVESLDLHLGRNSFKSMKKFSDRTYQINITTGFTETHGSARLSGIRLAQEFISRGIGLGDVVMICGNNSDVITAPILASLFLGAPIMPLAVTMVYGEIKAIVTMGLPKIIFCDAIIAPVFKRVLEEMELDTEIVILGESPSADFTPIANLLKATGTEEDFQVVDFDLSATAFIVGSSGTTGMPKGICLSHRAIAVNIMLPIKRDEWEQPTLKTFFSSPLFWLTGVYGYIWSFVRGSIRLYTPLTITAKIAFDCITRYKPEFVMLNPNAVSEAINHPEFESCDFSDITTFACIGSVLSHEKVLKIQAKLPKGRVVNNYGLTETTGTIIVPMGEKHIPGSCGKLLPWVKHKIVDPETNEELGVNQTGEIVFKSDYTLFTHYYRDPEATKNAFDKDGWFHTGDLLYYDEDKNFFFVERIREMFKYQDKQVVPCELEQVIRGLPGIQEVCVVGVEHTHENYYPKAFVQLVPGAKVTVDDIKNIVKDNLSDHKQLRGGVVLMDELPITHSGKVNRKAINAIKLTLVGS